MTFEARILGWRILEAAPWESSLTSLSLSFREWSLPMYLSVSAGGSKRRMGLKYASKSRGIGFWTVVLEKTLESPLDGKENKPVHPKGNQSWLFIGRTDAKALILWPPDVKNWFIWKDPDAGKDWRQEKGTTEDEMVGWHHWLDGHEFEHAPGVGEGQGSLVCFSPWGRKETQLNDWSELNRSWK